MHLKYSIREQLLSLQGALENLSDHQYTVSIGLLSGATIGQHIRHILEFFQELDQGYGSGLVDYDRRKRSLLLETNRLLAISQLSAIMLAVDRPDKELVLVGSPPAADGEPVIVQTNYFRELLFNREHTVHHMALLRIGITAVAGGRLPVEFGVAASTLQFRRACGD